MQLYNGTNPYAVTYKTGCRRMIVPDSQVSVTGHGLMWAAPPLAGPDTGHGPVCMRSGGASGPGPSRILGFRIRSAGAFCACRNAAGGPYSRRAAGIGNHRIGAPRRAAGPQAVAFHGPACQSCPRTSRGALPRHTLPGPADRRTCPPATRSTARLPPPPRHPNRARPSASRRQAPRSRALSPRGRDP